MSFLKAYYKYIIALILLLAIFIMAEFISTDEKDKVIIETQTAADYTFVDCTLFKQNLEEKIKGVKNKDELKDLFAKAEMEFEKDYYVCNSNIYLDQSGNIHLKIEPEKIAFRVLKPQGKSFYVSNEGKEMPLSLGKEFHTLFVMGDFNKQSYPNLILLSQKINDDKLLKSEVRAIKVSYGFNYELVFAGGGVCYYLGTVESLEQKLSNLKVMYSYLKDFNLMKKYASVNLEFVDFVTCKKINNTL